MVLVMVGGQLGHLKKLTSPHPAVTRSPDFKGVSWKTLLEFSLNIFFSVFLTTWMVENNRPYIATSDFANFGIFDPDPPDYNEFSTYVDRKSSFWSITQKIKVWWLWNHAPPHQMWCFRSFWSGCWAFNSNQKQSYVIL